MNAPQMKERQKGRVECACTKYLHPLLPTIQPPIHPTKQPKSHLPPSSTPSQNSRSVIPPVILRQLMHTNYTTYTHAYPHPATQAKKITAKTQESQTTLLPTPLLYFYPPAPCSACGFVATAGVGEVQLTPSTSTHTPKKIVEEGWLATTYRNFSPYIRPSLPFP
jgi:hypothetical protein